MTANNIFVKPRKLATSIHRSSWKVDSPKSAHHRSNAYEHPGRRLAAFGYYHDFPEFSLADPEGGDSHDQDGDQDGEGIRNHWISVFADQQGGERPDQDLGEEEKQPGHHSKPY